MDPDSGKMYASRAAAEAAGVVEPVMVEGTPEQVRQVSEAVRAAARKRNKIARKSRRNNR